MIFKSLKYCKNYQNTTQRHKVSKRCWQNGSNRLAWHSWHKLLPCKTKQKCNIWEVKEAKHTKTRCSWMWRRLGLPNLLLRSRVLKFTQDTGHLHYVHSWEGTVTKASRVRAQWKLAPRFVTPEIHSYFTTCSKTGCQFLMFC